MSIIVLAACFLPYRWPVIMVNTGEPNISLEIKDDITRNQSYVLYGFIMWTYSYGTI